VRKHSDWQARILAALLLAVLLAVIYRFLPGGLNLDTLFPPSPAGNGSGSTQPGRFDFYVLALSWSPDYCASAGASDPQQCSLGRRLGFVLHGLWPQYNKGYPSYCSTAKLPASAKAMFPALYPSPALYDHEWDKHGTCSGLTPEQYLALSQKLRDAVAIPAAYRAPDQPFRVTVGRVKKDFATANPGLGEGSLAVHCSGSGRYLQEVYVCLFGDGQPATCSSEIQRDAARACQAADFLVRNVR